LAAVWDIADPVTALPLAMLVGVAALWTRYYIWGRLIATSAALLVLGASTLQASDHLAYVLENRFPVPSPLGDNVTGIVVLGGSVNVDIMRARGQPTLNHNGDRLVQFVTLARQYPEARLVFAGGGSSPGETDEAAFSMRVLADLGLDPRRVQIENRSTSTRENAVFAYEMVRPKPDESWLLVTSAAHMPRAVGAFRVAGWHVVPYPTGFATSPNRPKVFSLGWKPFEALLHTRPYLYEFIALAVYRWRGWTSELLPAP